MKQGILAAVAAVLFIVAVRADDNRMSDTIDPDLQRVYDYVDRLRSLGFFSSYGDRSTAAVWEKVYADDVIRHSEMFGRVYKPALKDYRLFDIAALDVTKFWDLDAEADVCAGNRVYCWVIETVSVLSNGAFRPEQIEEKWGKDTGPIIVSYQMNGCVTRLTPEYQDDWIDGKVLAAIIEDANSVMSDRIYEVVDSNGWGVGQGATFVRLTPSQREAFERLLPWKIKVKKTKS